jgi:hypothetical protein
MTLFYNEKANGYISWMTDQVFGHAGLLKYYEREVP